MCVGVDAFVFKSHVLCFLYCLRMSLFDVSSTVRSERFDLLVHDARVVAVLVCVCVCVCVCECVCVCLCVCVCVNTFEASKSEARTFLKPANLRPEQI